MEENINPIENGWVFVKNRERLLIEGEEKEERKSFKMEKAIEVQNFFYPKIIRKGVAQITNKQNTPTPRIFLPLLKGIVSFTGPACLDNPRNNINKAINQ